jgi:type II secretion system protein H
MKRKIQQHKEQGFGLLDIIVVLVIIGVMTAIAVPAIQRSLQAYRLELAAGELSNSLTEARMYAVKRNRLSWVAINTTNKTIGIWSNNDAGNPVQLGTTKPLPEGLTIPGTSATTAQFNSLGRNEAGAVTNLRLQLYTTGRCRQVSVGVNGKVATADCP